MKKEKRQVKYDRNQCFFFPFFLWENPKFFEGRMS